MNHEAAELWSDALGAAGRVLRYGRWGRPVLVFPTEPGQACEFGDNGMVGALGALIEAGRIKLYCVDGYNAASWSNRDISLEDRARNHGRYESWILGEVVPWIYRDCGGALEVVALGCSLGAFHAANFALKRADLFPLAMCFSGNYDPSAWHAWGERGTEAYFNLIRHELDLWGTDVPHDWPSWRAQVAHHMPRFC
jgi:esterase/lipase superfamily enzyme